jgi:hypothetical protein
LVRLVLLQAREQLLAQLLVVTQLPLEQVMGVAGTETLEASEDIACALLDGLNSLPVECVATNGPSLVQKGMPNLASCSSELTTSPFRRDPADGIFHIPVATDRKSVSLPTTSLLIIWPLTIQAKAANAVSFSIECDRGDVHIWSRYLCRVDKPNLRCNRSTGAFDALWAAKAMLRMSDRWSLTEEAVTKNGQ